MANTEQQEELVVIQLATEDGGFVEVVCKRTIAEDGTIELEALE